MNLFRKYLFPNYLSDGELKKIASGVSVAVERARIVAYIKRTANDKYKNDERVRMRLLLVASYIEKQYHNDDVKLFGLEVEDENEEQESKKESEQS
jgi:uncharacterized protein YehS (DUF1456 family)